MKLRVWWIPQIPLKKGEMAFYQIVDTIQKARLVLDCLARYDLYQLEHKIKPDYSNMGGLEMFDGKDWLEWENDNGEDIMIVMNCLKNWGWRNERK